jgi:hypothetical protein
MRTVTTIACCSTRSGDFQIGCYLDARRFHDALVRANPERLMWATD